MRLAAGFIAVAVLAQDPYDTLAKARDKMLLEVPSSPKYTCVETIDRSYFSRYSYNPLSSSPSCERLSADRKKGRPKLRLDATDRLRVEVNVTQGREIYSWTGPGGFSQSVEEILQWGPIGTGAFAVHLMDIFADPSVRFRILGEKEETLEYGFRVPIEASHLNLRAGTEWRTTGYSGSFSIDRKSLQMRRFTMESEELPPQTTMCELSTTNEYQGENTLGLLLPSVSRSHNIMRDTTETDQVTTLSNCRESAAPPSRRGPDAALGLPERIPFELALATPIDTASAAAGDVISARLTGPLLGPSGKVLAPTGATATGRIVRMEHQLGARNYFLVSMAFDTLQVAGVELRLYARSDGNGKAMLSRQGHEDWPTGTFLFPGSNPQYVISAGYKSKWRTTAPTPTK